jgi:hypothetical protein
LDVQVIDFDPYLARFLVRNLEKKIKTWRCRLYITMEDDDPKKLEQDRLEVM